VATSADKTYKYLGFDLSRILPQELMFILQVRDVGNIHIVIKPFKQFGKSHPVPLLSLR
jgi:hypothetical protein